MPNKNIIDDFIHFIEKHYYLFLLLILLGAVFNLFYNLNNVPIDSWDEARHGISAYEMLRNNDYIVNMYENTIDYWNLKPPLSFWLICLGYKLVGFNALGLRLFSAIAAFITIVVVTLFSKYIHGKLASLMTASVITATTNYMLSHCARTGDADSLFVLFFTLSVVSLSLMERNIFWFYFSGFSMALAFLTKSWHTLGIIAIVGTYLLISKTFFIIRIKQWLVYFSAFSFPVIWWGVERYSRDGFKFFKEMIRADLLSRTSNIVEGHMGGADYYLLSLQENYSYWGVLLVASFCVYLFLYSNTPDKSARNYIFLMVSWIFMPLILYSFAKTKVEWYILCVYPPLAVCIGAFTGKLLSGIRRNIVLQTILCLGILFSLYENERTIQMKVTHFSPDPVQATIRMIGDKKEYLHANIYTVYKDDDKTTGWRQCDVLASELYADLTPKEGNVETFMKDKEKSLLIVPTSQKYIDIIAHRKLKIVAEGTEVYIVAK